MPGVKIVEEPPEDLWFPPDQCVVPGVASEQLDREGYWGLGEYYDPRPWQSLGSALGKRTSIWDQSADRMPFEPAQSARAVRTMPEFEMSPEVEAEIARQQEQEWSWRRRLPAIIQHAPEEVVEDVQNKVMYLSVNYKTGYSFNIRIQPYRGIMGEAWGREEQAEAVERGEQFPPPGYPRSRVMRLHESEAGTCVPTKWCMSHCYAKVGRFVSWNEQHWYNLSRQQARYLQNLIVSHMYERSSDAELTKQADVFYEQVYEAWYTRKGRKRAQWPEDSPMNLRLNGCGDYNAGTIRLFNRVAERHPDLLLWGFTRKRDTADLLVPRDNVRTLVSIDPSTPLRGEGPGYDLSDLMNAAYHLNGDLAFAADAKEYDTIQTYRAEIERVFGPDLAVAVVFGYHCGSLHTTLEDVMECSATNPRMYGWCQVCRWCMMNRAEKLEEGVRTPNQAYWLHGGRPNMKDIDRDNDNIETWNEEHPDSRPREFIEPMTEDEVWDV